MSRGLSPWIPERDETLKRMLSEGISFSKIAVELGGSFSRNAAIGRAHRLGLTAPKKENSVKKKKPPRLTAQLFSHRLENKSAPLPKFNPADIIPLNIPLLALEHHHCRWPYGEKDFVFCGHDKMFGESYCEGHCHLAYNYHRPAAKLLAAE